MEVGEWCFVFVFNRKTNTSVRVWGKELNKIERLYKLLTL